jgi:hypothetical protein
MLAGLATFAVFTAICLAAGEGATPSISGGVFIGVAVGGALALRHLISRHQLR